jgi:disulfide bond formation protein DsbB
MNILDALRARPRAAFALIALACLGSVAGALYGQHRLDMQPCPWCILQRIIYLAIAITAGLAALMPHGGPAGAGRLSTLLTALLVLLLGLAGAAAALYQNQVAAKLASCDLTLADRIISGLGLDAWMPDVFEVRASCAEAAVALFGVPFELWSLALYGVIVGAALLLMTSSPDAPDSNKM